MRNYLLSNTLEVGTTRDNSLICLSFKRRMQSRCYEPFEINQQSQMKQDTFGKLMFHTILRGSLFFKGLPCPLFKESHVVSLN